MKESNPLIHPSAIIDPSAVLATGVRVGPWTIIGPDVEIAEDTTIASHVVIKGPCKIGKNNQIFQFCSIGEDCQDKKYNGEQTYLQIGDNNIFRESCTIHRGTVQDNALTLIGSNNLFMVNVHVAHDCVIGDHVIMANNSAAAGHVRISDKAILGGFTAVHQFCHIGTAVMCAAGTVIFKDIPAFVMSAGNPAKPHGINAEGLKRSGYSPQSIAQIKRAYKIIYRQQLSMEDAIAKLQTMVTATPQIEILLTSLQQSTRGIIR
ncbi:acyl-[acyl-carrier-protein]--UDP-N-acetylglucosamine O-acyltransferase ['Osedax' symbiont bacterium Rs2_46_30_T18]|nr:acyl-[acyl-carrier-protein]--UDP-N-acetylglucosamine O-acyltransferase ['Osedax' symbiont bacterium Rs2_46_30_T18]